MAERRMFAKTIIDSDAFLDMPLSAQALYFHLSMRADDDGFINNPKKLQRLIGCADDDMRLLVAKAFIIPFESGVVVIKHWRINNYIRNDRYKPTNYTEEMAQLQVKENGAYTEKLPLGIPNGYQTDTQYRLGKDRLDKNIRGFTPPSIDEVSAYCTERNNGIDPQHFVDFYEAKGWMVGKNKMKDWKAAVRTWEGRQGNGYSKQHTQQNAGRDSAGDERWNLQSVNLE